ncbi:MAG TPA: hypothetical protein VFU71_22985, partial [Burkholderiaceae bacterium]|nr:hypothetical protein [Burkholderiaceae bacterium]
MSILRSLTGTDQCSGRGKLVLAAAALVAAVGSAQAGTTNAFAIVPAPGASAPVLSLQNIVTYADTVPDPKTGLTNQPQAGFVVGNFGANPGYLLQQLSGNSINRLTVTIAFSVIGSDGLLNTGEQLKFRDPSVYLAGLPSECGNLTNDTTAANPKTITCVFRQTKPGFT